MKNSLTLTLFFLLLSSFLFSQNDTIVPLDLIYFKYNGSSNLEWKTLNEVNVDRFDIEFTETLNFEVIGSIEANNEYENYYTFGISQNGYYRLAIVDLDGGIMFSNIIYAGNITNINEVEETLYNIPLLYDVYGRYLGNDIKYEYKDIYIIKSGDKITKYLNVYR